MSRPRPRPPDGSTPNDWLTFAQRDLDDADHALAGGRWESAGFSAIQAVEKCLKALARKDTTYVDLNGRPHSELNGLTYGQLEQGGDQANVHELVALVDLLRTWHQGAFARFRPDLAWIDRSRLYERLRYPERSVAGGAAPLTFGQTEAKRLRVLAGDVLGAVQSRL